MAYIGREPVIGNFVKLDAISVVNGQAAYTMNNGGSAFTAYNNVNQFLVSLNGVLQAPTDSFTVSGSTLTFASNLATGDVIDFVIVLGNTLDIGTPSDNTVTAAKIGANAVTSAKLNNDIISGATELASEPADTDEFLVSDAGTLKRIDYSLIKSSAGVYESQLLHIRDEKSSNTQGGTFTSGSWQQRDLNTIKTNEITGASLSSSNITLPSGTYYIKASAPAVEVASHKAKLYNVTDSSDVIIGTSQHNRSDNNYATSRSNVIGRFTISAEKVFMIAHRCSATRSNDGFGLACNFSVVEVYSDVQIWKVA